MGRASEGKSGPAGFLVCKAEPTGAGDAAAKQKNSVWISVAAAAVPNAHLPVRGSSPAPPHAPIVGGRSERLPLASTPSSIHTLCSTFPFLSSPQVVANGVPIFQVQGRIWATRGKGSRSLLIAWQEQEPHPTQGSLSGNMQSRKSSAICIVIPNGLPKTVVRILHSQNQPSVHSMSMS